MSIIPTKVNIKQLLILESGTYNQPYRRSYTTAENDISAVDELRDRLAGRKVTGPGAVSGLAGQIIKIESTPGDALTIDDNGWGGRRFIFMMEVEIYTRGSKAPNIQIVMGYSECNDMSLQQSINPQMHFTINSVVGLRSVVTVRNGREIERLVPFDCSHVLSDMNYRGLRKDTAIRIDPFDIATLMSADNNLYHEEGEKLYNYTGVHSKTPTKVQRKHSQSANYLGDVLGSFGNAYRNIKDSNNGFQSSIDHASLCDAAASHLSGSSAAGDAFLQAIRSVSPEGYLTNYFTLNDLERLHPGHPCDLFVHGEQNRVHGYRQSGVLGNETHEAGQTSDWAHNDLVTQFAAIVSNAVPGIMMEMFFTDVYFRASNRTIDGGIGIEMLSVPSTFKEFDYREFLESFERRLTVEVLNDACMQGQIDFELECRCSVVGESWVVLSVNGEEPVEFNTPSFCDALFTPMIATADNANGIARDLNTIVNDIVLGQNTSNAMLLNEVDGFDYDSRQSRKPVSVFRDSLITI